MAKKKINSAAFALEFIGSLFFLFLVYAMSANLFSGSSIFSGFGGFWLPIFVGIGTISAIALFLFSFTYLTDHPLMHEQKCKMGGMGLSVAAGVSFVALTLGSTGYFVVAIIGFVIAAIGAFAGYS